MFDFRDVRRPPFVAEIEMGDRSKGGVASLNFTSEQIKSGATLLPHEIWIISGCDGLILTGQENDRRRVGWWNA